MATTLVRKVLMQIEADDGDTEAKLDRITAKADELKELHPEIAVKIDAAAASAKLGVLRQELKDVGKPVDIKIDDGDALAKTAALDLELEQLKAKNSGSGGGLLSKILFGSGGESGGGGSGGIFGGLSNIPVLGDLLGNPVALVGVLAALMAVGSEVAGLATGLTAAGLGVGAFAALAIPAFTQVTGALGDTKKQFGKLPEPIRQAAGQVRELENDFKAMSKAFEPTVFKVMNEGLGIAGQLLPYLSMFATATAPAIEGVLQMFSSGLNSGQFGQFIELMLQLSGPVVTAVGSGMKGLAGDVMELMTRFSQKDVINSINIAFRLIGFTISLVTGLIMEGMDAWDLLTEGLHAARVGFDVTRHAVAAAGHDIKQWGEIAVLSWDLAVVALKAGAHDVSHGFDGLRHDIATDGHDIAVYFDNVRHGAAVMAHDAAAHFDEIRHDAAQWADDVRHDVDRVIAWFEALPHRLLVGAAVFGSLLVNAGESLVDGLINGIDSKFDALKSKVFGLGDDVKGWIKDAWKMASPSKVFAEIGANIPLSLGLGITQSSASALSKARTLAKDITDAVINGSISRSQAAQLSGALAASLKAALRQSIGQALGPSLQTELTTTGKITKASLAALVQIWDAEKGGLISLPEASSLAKWVKADNARLQTLATARAKIANEITAAKALASGTATATEGTYNLSSAAGSGASPATPGSIIGTLKGDVIKIRTFAANIRKLAKEGLNKSYLSQLIAMGPDSGGQLAQELAAAGLGDIRQINAAEGQITAASNQLGDAAVSAMDAGGRQSGTTFVKTLESQQADINAVMGAAARHLVAELRKDLGASALAGSTGKVEIRLVGGDKAFRTWLKKMIRVTGGNVQVVGA